MLTPQLRSWRELPISVQHVWDSYPLVDQALVDLEQGQFQSAAMLADAVYTDDRVIGVLSTRVNALFGLEMEFKYPGEGESEDEDEKDEGLELKRLIRDTLKKNWEKMFPTSALREFVRWGLMLNAGLGEFDWGWEGDLWFPVLKTWNPQFLYWRWDTRSYWLITTSGPVELRPGNGKWLLYSPTGHNHGWLYGLIRALGKLWIDRQFAFKDWARASEKYSLGMLLGKFPSDADPSDVLKLQGSIANAPNESFVMLPQQPDGKAGFDVSMLETDSAVNWESFQQRIHQLDTSIAVCVLGQNLTTEVREGSKAAGQIHDNVRGDFLKSDNQVLKSCLNAQALTPWVTYNWGDIIEELGGKVEEFVPQVQWKVDPPEDKKDTAAAIGSIASAIPNLIGTPADIRKVLDEHGIPVLGEGEVNSAPAADVNERPRSEDIDPSAATDPEGAPHQQPLVTASRRVSTPAGSRKGQRLADALADLGRQAGKLAMGDRRRRLLELIQKAKDFESLRAELRAFYAATEPGEMRRVTERCLIAAELLGRVSASVDVK